MRRRPTKGDPRCSFCGRSHSQVEKIITGPSVHICNECIKLCNEVLVEEKKETLTWENGEIPKPNQIKNFLDEYVIAQERAKKILSVAVYNHYKRINHSKRKSEIEIQKSNIILVGQTGTGKTAIAKYICEQIVEKANDENKKIHTAYINCKQTNTPYGILANIGKTYYPGLLEKLNKLAVIAF